MGILCTDPEGHWKLAGGVNHRIRVIRMRAPEGAQELHDYAIHPSFTAVSASKRVQVCDYIARQEEHHKKRTFQDEYVEFLRRCGVDYDRQYLW